MVTQKIKRKIKKQWKSIKSRSSWSLLVQCNLVDNQYQNKSEVLYTFVPNKSYAYLLDVEPSNLVFLKIYNTEFDEIIIRFKDQNGRLLKIKDKVDLTLLINEEKYDNIL